MATVHLIDDDPARRMVLARRLQAAGHAVRTYGATGEYLASEASDDPGCLLLALHRTAASGLPLQATLRQHPRHARPVVYLSLAAEARDRAPAVHAGARQFLVHPVADDVLLVAVADAIAQDAAQRAERERAHEGVRTERASSMAVCPDIGIGVGAHGDKADRARLMARLGVRSLSALRRLLAEAGPPDEPPEQAMDLLPPASAGRADAAPTGGLPT
jgi:FixJ family two-component response regulator